MASFNEYSIGRFGLCLNRNRDLLTRLFQASEPVYYSQVVEDDAYTSIYAQKYAHFGRFSCVFGFLLIPLQRSS